MQSGVTISNNAVTAGTLAYVNDYTGFSSDTDLQKGNYLALHWSNPDSKITSLKVGLVPSSIGMDLVEVIDDPDRNGVFRVTNENTQVFKIVQADGVHTHEQSISLRGITLASEVEG